MFGDVSRRKSPQLRASTCHQDSTVNPQLPAIVDWELARLGDPRWDIGTVFAEYLSHSFGASKMRSGPATRVSRRGALAGYRSRNSVRTIWRAYADDVGLGSAERQPWLAMATQYAAAKLVETAFEFADNQPGIPEWSIDLLQASLNTFRFPDEVVQTVLGLG